MAFTKIVPAGINTGGSYTLQDLDVVGVLTAASISGPLTGDATGLSGTPDVTVGAITAASADFSGNVSIAGTLTYEDVTNIDSVGVITARSGLHVTGGSVGIGTDNPGSLLHIGADTPTISLDNTARTDNIGKIFSGSGSLYLQSRDGSSHGSIIFRTENNSTETERLRISSDGNVGIGSAIPTDVLDILTGSSDQVTSLKVKEQGRIELSRNHSDAPYIKTLMNSGNPNIILGDSAGDKVLINGDGFSYFNGGNIGIGTDNPGRLLHLYDIDAPPLLIDRNLSGERYIVELRQSDTTDGNRFRLAYQSDTTGAGAASNVNFASIEFAADIHDQATRAGSIRFNTSQGGVGNEIERLRITSSGNVGIGTDNPGKKLDIYSSALTAARLRVSGGGYNWVEFASDDNSGNITVAINDRTGVDGVGAFGINQYNSSGGYARTPIRVDTNGNIGLGTVAPTRQLHVNSPSVDPYILVDGSGGNRDGGYKLNNGGGEVTVIRGDVGKNVYYHDGNVLMNQNVSGFNQVKGNVQIDSQLLLGNLATSNPSSVVIYRFLGAKNLSYASGGGLVTGQTDTISGVAGRITTSNNSGTFFFGPYGHIHPGTYTALFRMKVSANTSSSFMGYIDVTGNGVSNPQGQGTLRPRVKNIYPNIFTSANKYQYVALDFDWVSQASGSNYIETRYINYVNSLSTDIYIDHIIITHRLPLA